MECRRKQKTTLASAWRSRKTPLDMRSKKSHRAQMRKKTKRTLIKNRLFFKAKKWTLTPALKITVFPQTLSPQCKNLLSVSRAVGNQVKLIQTNLQF